LLQYFREKIRKDDPILPLGGTLKKGKQDPGESAREQVREKESGDELQRRGGGVEFGEKNAKRVFLWP